MSESTPFFINADSTWWKPLLELLIDKLHLPQQKKLVFQGLPSPNYIRESQSILYVSYMWKRELEFLIISLRVKAKYCIHKIGAPMDWIWLLNESLNHTFECGNHDEYIQGLKEKMAPLTYCSMLRGFILFLTAFRISQIIVFDYFSLTFCAWIYLVL